jgi:hypothetical protein
MRKLAPVLVREHVGLETPLLTDYTIVLRSLWDKVSCTREDCRYNLIARCYSI